MINVQKNEEYRLSDPPFRRKIRQKLADAFDVNYEVAQISVNTMEDFQRELYQPFVCGKKIYYRGERICSPSRRLIPTLLRTQDVISQYAGKKVVDLDSRAVFDYYCAKPSFLSVYETIYGTPSVENMYNMLAFAQHYLDVSPFIDFTKSLFVALSFALKGREEFCDDIVLYTAFDIGDDDTTQSVHEVNGWLENYNVHVVTANIETDMKQLLAERRKRGLAATKELRSDLKQLERILTGMMPTAKLIDIPTNDLMKYQQGVFLLLNDFSLIDSKYLTKAVRQSFVIDKYIISRDICPQLRELLVSNAPQYRYECLLNISRAVRG